MRYQSNIREEELKNRVADDFFGKYSCNDIIKNIDFAVKAKNGGYLLWAEAKKSATDIIAMLSQLVLTIGKARTFNEVLPPKFLGCFDCEKIAFIPYADIQDVFHQNDFNWNVAPSNHNSREFKQIYSQINSIINNDKPHKTYCFDFERDEKSLKLFILKNFMVGGEISKIRIDKNNFISVYGKWLEAVKPTIDINWAVAKKHQIIDGDFYLADLISRENLSIKEKLNVLLKSNRYELDRKIDDMGLFSSRTTGFTDKQKAHAQFWAIYERPPREDYWDYIIERRDLLVPQDIRERKGSFFTPKIWVELSQKYIADALGENWQEEYYVWDCAAGTGNLLAGLTNKYNIWASTLDKADVDVMHDRIENGANLLKEHCFQFDFLNDDFGKLPEGLREIIDDPKKRKKLVVYINPPYAEAGTGLGKKHKEKVATINATYEKYKNIGKASNELFIQFLARIYGEVCGCYLANFSKLKNLQAPNFLDFRNFFLAKLEKLFIVPADTFDNVNGQFPIGFFIWNTGKKEKFKEIMTDVFSKAGKYLNKKKIFCYDNEKGFINDWLRSYADKSFTIGILHNNKNDFQHNNQVRITSDDIKDHTVTITPNNLIPVSIYFSVRHCIEATWLNDRDQFLYPNDGWEEDDEFQNDCIAYTLFHGQNNISSKHGTNHWIPFIEWDVEPKDKFKSHFMTDFFAGPKYFIVAEPTIFYNASPGSGDGGSGARKKLHNEKTELKFSKTAKNVFHAGLNLWRYYHKQPKCNANASLYDIREHFQGRNPQGKMNNKSDDEKYNELIGSLREALKELAKKIEPKVYEYGFLRG
ncbi:hypothetical protein R83H12_00303 [Fibrobacteria bacterium R8-3-H12]